MRPTAPATTMISHRFRRTRRNVANCIRETPLKRRMPDRPGLPQSYGRDPDTFRDCVNLGCGPESALWHGPPPLACVRLPADRKTHDEEEEGLVLGDQRNAGER